jgi:hypothetical protein
LLVVLFNLGEDNTYPRKNGSNVRHSPNSLEDLAIMGDLKSDPCPRWRSIPRNQMASKQAQVPGFLRGFIA